MRLAGGGGTEKSQAGGAGCSGTSSFNTAKGQDLKKDGTAEKATKRRRPEPWREYKASRSNTTLQRQGPFSRGTADSGVGGHPGCAQNTFK